MRFQGLSLRAASGFSLTEIMATLAVFSVLAAMAVPLTHDALEAHRVTIGARDVERELQTARIKAVTTNRPLRVRFNCPTTGQYRIVEVVGVAGTDSATNRCDAVAYPYPAADRNPATRPNFDGPIRFLDSRLTVAGSDLEFAPDGTTRQLVTGTPQPIGTTVTMTVAKGSTTRTVIVNGLGRIQIQ